MVDAVYFGGVLSSSEAKPMRRREFIALFGGTVAVWPFVAQAQQGQKLVTVGLLGSGTAAAQSTWTAAFVQRMRELGWIEGRNLGSSIVGPKDTSSV